MSFDLSRLVARLLAAGCLLALLLPGPARATAPAPAGPPPQLQAAVDHVVADGVPGVIALERQGAGVVHATSGTGDLRDHAPIRAFDRFRIGSISKSFLSTVVLQLVGEGRLSLTDSVERWLPGAVPGGAGITVHELLNHTSGLFDYINDPDGRVVFPYFYDGDRDYYWRPDQLLAIATSHPPAFTPGTAWRYSNTGYIVLGMIVQAVTHDDPVREIERRIIDPLGLTATSFPTRDPSIAGPHTHGYLPNPPPITGLPPIDTTTFSPSWAWTAGAIVSTVDDVARFHRALFTGRLLAPAQIQELESTVPTPTGLDYGLGVFRLPTPCGDAWGHDGIFFGYTTLALTSLDGSRQAVISLNASNTLSTQAQIDEGRAALTAFCGRAIGGGQAPAVPHLDAA